MEVKIPQYVGIYSTCYVVLAGKRARMFLFMCGWKYAEGGDVG